MTEWVVDFKTISQTKAMDYVDTHCHIHDAELFQVDQTETVLAEALGAGVVKILCVATSLADSRAAISFAKQHPKNCWASVGIHPHEAARLTEAQIMNHLDQLAELAADSKVIAVGECGFDFYYNRLDEAFTKQQLLLEGQLQIALDHNLPVSFHVREAFSEFWPVFSNFSGLKGVLHSFTDRAQELEKALAHDLYIGVNGISTFTKLPWQQDLFRALPLERIVVETDTPFLTPLPHRGKINSPKNVIYITKHLAELRGEDESTIRQSTTANARKLLGW